jgi:hypothetical protein
MALLEGQADHIELNAGNVMAIGLLSLLWYGFADWTCAWLAKLDVPLVSQLAAGGYSYLHGTGAK